MSEDMVKKSVDITQEDQEWLENSPINFSKFVRRQIAQRRAESLRDHIKEKLHADIVGMAEKGQELMEEYREQKKELQEEFPVEIYEENHTHGVLKHEDDLYTIHWRPDEPFANVPEEPPEQVQEFGEAFMDSWFDKLDRFGDFVDQQTRFEIVGGDEATQDLEGTGLLDRFTLHTKYLPTDPELFTVKFASRVDLEFEDLEPQ